MSRITWVMLFILLAACQAGENGGGNETQPEENEQDEMENDEKFYEVASNLKSPWDMEEYDGLFLISERGGTIARISSDDQVQREQVSTDKEISQIGEGGLLGLKLDPDFENNQLAFAYHTYEEAGEIKNRVIQLRYAEGEWREEKSLLENIPGNNFHNGGRIEIGPDENLYVTTGDAQNEQLAQDEESLAGKILRMDLDGNIPEGNPIDNSYIYSMGHRNPQGLDWTEDSTLFATEHGPTNHDEVNKIDPGANYGWPEIVGDESQDGYQDPLFQTGNDTWAPSGMVVYKDELYVAALNGEALMNLDTEGNETEVVTSDYGRLRDVELVNEELYFITNNTDGRGNPEGEDDKLVRFYP
ncbi:PQQ-dependent sugar dehydrogenase [Halobacillus sp. B23F22_1]|uniref:PQQ-dependent sugar dehydrogenase n=1 Tax=Halobacillus sp. B23F22_1 TaxID=3459514 RepID=UPI00373F22B1